MIDKVTIEILVNEKKELRIELMEYIKSQTRILFTFILVVVSSVAVISTKDIFNFKNSQQLMTLLLSQLEFLLAVINLSFLSAIFNIEQFIRAIEHKINSLTGQYILIWESEIVNKYIHNTKSIRTWIQYFIVFCAFVIYVFLIYSSISLIGIIAALLISIIEIGLLTFFYIMILKKLSKLYELALKLYNEEEYPI